MVTYEINEKPKKKLVNLKRWRRKVFWVVVGMIALELALIVAFLTLVGISDPNTYRTKLWEDGYLNGFNSSPDEPLYAAANYRTSTIPLVWSQSITTFNLIISILATFLLILKIILIPFHFLWPITSFILHGLEVGLFSYSIYGQTGPDTLDPEHPNTGLPWYIAKSCDVAHYKRNVGFCQQAKATFCITVVLLALYAIFTILSVHAFFSHPTPGQTDQDTNFMTKRFPKFAEAEQTYEYQPQTPMPYTPRTPWSGWQMDNLPPTPSTLKSPATEQVHYAPHAGYATPEAAQERERGVSQYGFAPQKDPYAYGYGVPTILPPVTPRTKAFNALEGGGNGQPGSTTMKAEWGRREQGNLPWSGRNSGGARKSGGSFT